MAGYTIPIQVPLVPMKIVRVLNLRSMQFARGGITFTIPQRITSSL
jgi:hypothetical protein